MRSTRAPAYRPPAARAVLQVKESQAVVAADLYVVGMDSNVSLDESPAFQDHNVKNVKNVKKRAFLMLFLVGCTVNL